MNRTTRKKGLRKHITRLVGVLHELQPNVHGRDSWHTESMLHKGGKTTTMTAALFAACLSRHPNIWVQMLHTVCGMIVNKHVCVQEIKHTITEFVEFQFILNN
jgi:hypothetical protein